MDLIQMRVEVRRKIDDVNAEHYVDAEINDLLNEGLSILVGDTHAFENTIQFLTALPPATAMVPHPTVPAQEYALIGDVDEIMEIQYYDGFLFPLVEKDRSILQQGNQITGIPDSFYTRRNSSVLAGQIANLPPQIIPITSTMAHLAAPQLATGQSYAFVVGLFPVPNVIGKTVTVTYRQKASGLLVADTDIPPVDVEYHRAIVDYAIALCFEKDQFYAQADRALGKWEKRKMEYHNKLKFQGTSGFRKVKLHDEPQPRRKVNIYIGKVT